MDESESYRLPISSKEVIFRSTTRSAAFRIFSRFTFSVSMVLAIIVVPENFIAANAIRFTGITMPRFTNSMTTLMMIIERPKNSESILIKNIASSEDTSSIEMSAAA